MRFWDSSALVPLVLEEIRSAACRDVYRADRTVVVWALTRTEIISAVSRRFRERKLTKADVNAARRQVEVLASTWVEVLALEEVRERAERLLGLHPLTAADAMQLGAALALVRDRPKKKVFVTADDRLADAATAEGFDVIVP